MKVSVLTLGCRVNQSESDIIEGNLKNFGWDKVNLTESPDYCIINTCSVTAKSDYQSRQLIRRAVRSGAKVIVTGCYSQQNQEEVKNIQGVFRIVQNVNKYHIINMLSNANESYTFTQANRSRPYLKIQDGCNHACSYCSVPFTRGESVSIPVSEVIRQAMAIDAAGFHEIVITGIHLGSYGYDLKHKSKLSYILRSILNKTTIKRIRLSSIGIKDIDNELIDLLLDERICRHLHLPLQSGSDDILRLMNRMYSAKNYITTIEKIIKKAPGLAIGTDVIVGFPGEGEKEFSETRQLLDNLPITYIHTFPFSVRPHTLAAKMANQNTSAVKNERVKELKALSDRKKMTYMLSQMDKTLDIIIEGHRSDNTSIGTSSNYLKVKIPINRCPKGAFVTVRISSIIEDNCLRGELVENIQLNDFK
jgi:threonylcarbamoyladenosine tRNA methylthiotransferase MtaB